MGNILRSRAAAGLAVIMSSTLGLASCASEFTRTGSSPSFLIVESMLGASGDEPSNFAAPLFADVEKRRLQTVDGAQVCVPVIFNDLGQVRVRAALKNQTSPTGPSAINTITIDRYHVVFRRADGRNTPGVDVPHPFDGAATFTVPTEGSAAFAFDMVRIQAKLETPLRAMVGNGGSLFISTLAEITFYGHDQAGNEVSVVATLTVNFGDFADEC
jgi:hypothetical protein